MQDIPFLFYPKMIYYISMKINFHTIEFMSAEADMGCKNIMDIGGGTI